MSISCDKTVLGVFLVAICCWMNSMVVCANDILPGDILVNEIMSQPEKNTSLPQKQYVELFNHSDRLISLSNWSLNSGTILDGFISEKGYVLLCAMEDTAAFSRFGKVIGVKNWEFLKPESIVLLRNNNKIVVDYIPYNKDTYGDTLKQKGGWSLELTAPGYEGDCPKYLYWSAAEDSRGGTPGKQNKTGFKTTSIPASYTMLHDTIWEIDFKHPMNRDDVENTKNYRINNGITITKAQATTIDASKVHIHLKSALQKNILYTFIIPKLNGCAGFIHPADTFEIAFTALPKETDLVINEILTQPNTGGVQFVEIYNKSSSMFKISDLVLIQADIVSGTEQQVLKLDSIKGYIYPNEYMVFSSDRSVLKLQYPSTILEHCVDVSLPPLSEETDYLLLSNNKNETIDAIKYYTSWHSPLLTNRQGVSLERSSFTNNTQDSKNWHSAAKEVGYATPGFQNSENSYALESSMHVFPEIFSPDGDGIEDELHITYSFEEAGSIVNLYILQIDGRIAIQLADHLAIPKEGVFIWDGQDKNGQKLPVNIYFIVMERETIQGEKILYKSKCGLASKLQ